MIVAAGTLVAGLIAAVVLTLAVVRRARRSPTLRRARLACARSMARSTPRRELARLRVDVFEARAATASILRLMGACGSHGELRVLHHRLERIAETVEWQLDILSHEPDDRALEQALPRMRNRVAGVTSAATDVRAAASLLVESSTDQELDELGELARREVQALTHAREVLGRATAAT